MNDTSLEIYWHDIPVGVENAVTYDELCSMWGTEKRTVRRILHRLSVYDNGDDYVLIRSGSGKGFYKTNDEETLSAYRKECLNKGRSNFAPIRKINRVMSKNANALQGSVFNNLRAVRTEKGLSQSEVCQTMKQHDSAFDVPMLSKMENGVFLPSPFHLSLLAQIYGVEPRELVAVELFALDIYAQI